MRLPVLSRSLGSWILLFVLLVMAPLAIVGGMVAADRMFGGHGRGRDYVIRLALPPAGKIAALPTVQGPLDASRPLVVIDAGHGGHDPGAGTGAMREKLVTLALAQALRDRLLAGGGIRVALTRDDDRFLLLPERAAIARQLKADLFISVHADSADNGEARGATIYSLSDRGSNEEASRLAAKENRADTINGVDLAHQSDVVSAILVDLSQRETSARSAEFARVLLREARGRVDFRPEPIQSAAFVVLKSADVPSVLLEAGYISNADDAARLASPEGQGTLAEAAARAVRIYFARQLRQP